MWFRVPMDGDSDVLPNAFLGWKACLLQQGSCRMSKRRYTAREEMLPHFYIEKCRPKASSLVGGLAGVRKQAGAAPLAAALGQGWGGEY